VPVLSSLATVRVDDPFGRQWFTMNTYQIISLVLQLSAFSVVAYQLLLVLRTLRADHERRRKQASIEKLGHEYRECRYALESKFGTKHITAEEIVKIASDDEYEANVKRLLGVLEHIAVGVNSGIYDKELVFRMSSGSMIDIYRRMEPFIVHRRNTGYKWSYVEFQHLIREFEGKKIIIPMKDGNIRFSSDS